MGRMKIIIVGLPLFSKRLEHNLREFDPSNSYKSLDTYYNKLDKLKALIKIPKSDCIFSINGSITKSKVFDIAFKNNSGCTRVINTSKVHLPSCNLVRYKPIPSSKLDLYTPPNLNNRCL